VEKLAREVDKEKKIWVKLIASCRCKIKMYTASNKRSFMGY
jgi:hypothetical protein